jgi:hypothetical protein
VLQDENNSYKNILDKIPNWIIKLFARKKTLGDIYMKKIKKVLEKSQRGETLETTFTQTPLYELIELAQDDGR